VADLSKYEVLLNDLNTIQTQVSVLKNKFKDTTLRNTELENLVIELKREKSALTEKIELLESEIKNFQMETKDSPTVTSNLEEREALKVKIKNLISRIDYHLSADRQI
jgi:chromosome segregation ATPase